MWRHKGRYVKCGGLRLSSCGVKGNALCRSLHISLPSSQLQCCLLGIDERYVSTIIKYLRWSQAEHCAIMAYEVNGGEVPWILNLDFWRCVVSCTFCMKREFVTLYSELSCRLRCISYHEQLKNRTSDHIVIFLNADTGHTQQPSGFAFCVFHTRVVGSSSSQTDREMTLLLLVQTFTARFGKNLLSSVSHEVKLVAIKCSGLYQAWRHGVLNQCSDYWGPKLRSPFECMYFICLSSLMLTLKFLLICLCKEFLNLRCDAAVRLLFILLRRNSVNSCRMFVRSGGVGYLQCCEMFTLWASSHLIN